MSVTTARGGEGRPAQSLSIIVSAAYAAALDIGHRHVLAALVLTLTGTAAAQGPASIAGLPSNFQWSSSGVLISPQPDASHAVVSVKDPSVVRYKGQWLVYATTANTSGGWRLQYTHFSDWSQAPSAPRYFLDSPRSERATGPRRSSSISRRRRSGTSCTRPACRR